MKKSEFAVLNNGKTLATSCMLVVLLFITGCKIPGSNIDMKDAGMDIAKGNVVSGNQGYVLKVDSFTNTVTLQVLPKYNKPLCDVNVRKMVFSESSNEYKEITENEKTYNDDGKLVKEYVRHEIPAKNKAKTDYAGILLASMPSWLILAGLTIFLVYKFIKWVRNERKIWITK